MSYQIELRRLTDRLKRIKQRQNVELATVTDTSPYAKYGFLIARLVNETPVNVRAWAAFIFEVGQEIMIQRINDKDSDWWMLVGLNGSTTSTVEGGVAYTPPSLDPVTIGLHDIAGALHTGLLPWGRIDLSDGKPDLATDVQGILPRANQEPQIRKLTLQTEIAVGDGSTVTGSIVGCTMGLVRSVALTGGMLATLRLLEEPAGAVEYATVTATPTPYLDQALPFFHEDALRDQRFYYELTNDGIDPATFVLTIVAMAMD